MTYNEKQKSERENYKAEQECVYKLPTSFTSASEAEKSALHPEPYTAFVGLRLHA